MCYDHPFHRNYINVGKFIMYSIGIPSTTLQILNVVFCFFLYFIMIKRLVLSGHAQTLVGLNLRVLTRGEVILDYPQKLSSVEIQNLLGYILQLLPSADADEFLSRMSVESWSNAWK